MINTAIFSTKISILTLGRVLWALTHTLKLKHAVSISDSYLWEEAHRQISEQTCRLKLQSKLSLYSSALEVYSFSLVKKDFSPPTSSIFTLANQWLICISSLLFLFHFILYKKCTFSESILQRYTGTLDSCCIGKAVTFKYHFHQHRLKRLWSGQRGAQMTQHIICIFQKSC